jgi:hypothetical protein
VNLGSFLLCLIGAEPWEGSDMTAHTASSPRLRRRTPIAAITVAAAVGVVAAIPAAAATPTTTSGVINGVGWQVLDTIETFSTPLTVLDTGQVVGNDTSAYLGGAYRMQPWTWQHGQLQPLGNDGGRAWVTDASLAGAVGYVLAADGERPVRWSGGNPVTMQTGETQFSVGLETNDRGDVLVNTASGPVLVTRSGQKIEITPPAGLARSDASASGLNDRREVVLGVTSYDQTTGQSVTRNFTWKDGVSTPVGHDSTGYPGSDFTSSGFSDTGYLGWSELDPKTGLHRAWLRRDGHDVPLSKASADAQIGWHLRRLVNDSGHVLGTVHDPDGTMHQVLWRDGTQVQISTGNAYNLTLDDRDQVLVNPLGVGAVPYVWAAGHQTPLPTPPGFTPGSFGRDLNNGGQVVGTVDQADSPDPVIRRTIVWTLPQK